MSWDPAPNSAHLPVSLWLCSSRNNSRGELRALEERHVSSKSPSRVRNGDEGVAGRNYREMRFPMRGPDKCPPDKSMIFTYLSSLVFDCYDPLLQMYQAVASLQPADTPPAVFSLSQQLGKELWLDGPTFSLLFNYKDNGFLFLLRTSTRSLN